MPEIHPDCRDPDVEFRHGLEALILQAKEAGLDDDDIHEIMRREMHDGSTAAHLNIPTKADVEVVMEWIQAQYDEVGEAYELHDNPDSDTARRGSLCMELWAQLSDQGYSRYD